MRFFLLSLITVFSFNTFADSFVYRCVNRDKGFGYADQYLLRIIDNEVTLIEERVNSNEEFILRVDPQYRPKLKKNKRYRRYKVTEDKTISEVLWQPDSWEEVLISKPLLKGNKADSLILQTVGQGEFVSNKFKCNLIY